MPSLRRAAARESRARDSARSVVNSRNARPPLAFSTGIAAAAPARKAAERIGRPSGALRELIAALGLRAQLFGKRLQRRCERLQRLIEVRSPHRVGLRYLPRHVAD